MRWTPVVCLIMAAACANEDAPVELPRGSAIGPSWPASSDPAMISAAAKDGPFDAANNVIRLTGAVNETLGFQFNLEATQPSAGLTVSVEDFTGESDTIDQSAIRIYRFYPVQIERFPNWYLRSIGLREPRAFADALVPIDAPSHGQPFVFPAGQALSLYIEIQSPGHVAPGRYASAVVIRDTDGNEHRTPIDLDLRDIYLPRDLTLPALARVNIGPIIRAFTTHDPENLKVALDDPNTLRVLRATFRLLHDHGLSPYTDEVYPRFRQDEDGAIILEWTQYDALCAQLIDGSAYTDERPAAMWPLPVGLAQPDPARYGGTTSATYAAVLKRYLERVRAHFADRGALKQAFVYFDLPRTPNPSSEEVAAVRQLAQLTHNVDPSLPFVTTLIPQSMRPFGWFEHVAADLDAAIDIWSPPARYQHPPTLEKLRALGKRTWLLPDRPPFSGAMAVEAPPVHARSLGWQAFLMGHDGINLRDTTDWPMEAFTSPIDIPSARSDTWLAYPGTFFGLDSPVPSVRLKQLQLGLQDYQYLRLLAQHGRAATATLIARSLLKATGTDAYGDNYQDGLFGRRVDDPALWEVARRILVEEVEAALRESGDAPIKGGGADRALWERFLSATRTIELWTESARLSPRSSGRNDGYALAFDVAVRSELRTPLSGTIDPSDMLTDMRRLSDSIRIGPLDEMDVARRQLELWMPGYPPVDLNGHFLQGILFDGGPSGRTETIATLSVVFAPPAPFPVTVDGDLSDWPPNDFNAAGDFRLINGTVKNTALRAPAESQTIAYFCHDDTMLYIALHAAGPSVGETPKAFSNVVDYEDLMPRGDDLIEILIDPSARATQSGELYHIVLKSTGDPVFERGIGVVPPIGERGPWPGLPPQYAVRPTDNGWAAEVAISLQAFGGLPPENSIWAINVARLEPERGEYSDWARAARYCYDPRTLGNLVWRR